MEVFISICCVTFNHGKFIDKTIKGFLMQKTSFPFEIIIHDDASTDNTVDIVKKYALKDERIKPIFQNKNQFSLGKKIFLNFLWPHAKGKYIALCEGDDYWTDPLKLQKQVDFLEKNPDFAICHHNMQIVYEDEPDKNRISNPNQKEITTIKDLAKGNYIFTASCVYRKYNYNIPEWFNDSPIGDFPLHILNAQYGKIKFFKEVMGVYRVHKGGMWEHTEITNRLKKTYLVYELLINHFKNNKNIRKYLIKTQINLCIAIIENSNFKINDQNRKYFEVIKKNKSKFLNKNYYTFNVKRFFNKIIG